MAQIDLKEARIYLRDGDSNELEIKIGEGNLSWTETTAREYTLDRGLLSDVRNGDETPMSVNFDFTWEYLKGNTNTGATPTVEDVLKKRGAAADWVSTDADACRPFAIDIVVLYQPDCLPGDQEEITLPDFRSETLAHDLRAGTVACTGMCNATEPVIVRSAMSTPST